jgi:hypothetical protein
MDEINIKITQIENKLNEFKRNLNFELLLIDDNINELTESIIEIKSILELIINKYRHMAIMLNHKYE